MSRHSSGLSQPARHVLFFETAPRAKYYAAPRAALIRLGHFADRQMSGGRGRERGWDNGMPAGKLGQTINIRPRNTTVLSSAADGCLLTALEEPAARTLAEVQ